MSLELEQKKAVVGALKEVAQGAYSAIGADYRGLTVGEMTELRRTARAADVHLCVVRNNLARRALQDTEFECMSEGLVGPFILAFSLQDPGAAARVVHGFAKTNDKLVVKLVSIGGKLLAPGEIKVLASLPTREQALGRLLALIKAPVTKLTRTLAEPHAKMVRTVAAIRDQKQAA